MYLENGAPQGAGGAADGPPPISPINAMDVKAMDCCQLACAFCVNEDSATRKTSADPARILRGVRALADAPRELAQPKSVFITGGDLRDSRGRTAVLGTFQALA